MAESSRKNAIGNCLFCTDFDLNSGNFRQRYSIPAKGFFEKQPESQRKKAPGELARLMPLYRQNTSPGAQWSLQKSNARTDC